MLYDKETGISTQSVSIKNVPVTGTFPFINTFNINIICYSTDSTDDEMEGKL